MIKEIIGETVVDDAGMREAGDNAPYAIEVSDAVDTELDNVEVEVESEVEVELEVDVEVEAEVANGCVVIVDAE
jgi:hypothetical protein